MNNRLVAGGKSACGIALFLDFDGTLTPIRKDPSQCFLTDGLREKLRALACCGRLRIVVLSGRTLSDVRKRIGLKKIFYAGNHGLEISGPGIAFIHSRAREAGPLILRAKSMLEKALLSFDGAWLEDKKYTLSLHFRNATSRDAAAVKRIFYRSVSEFTRNGSLNVMKGKKVLELIPAASWNKGKAALMVLDLLGNNWLPVTAGDDVTDETAFESLRKRGITVRVGTSQKTSAQYHLKNQGEVERFIASIWDSARKI